MTEIKKKRLIKNLLITALIGIIGVVFFGILYRVLSALSSMMSDFDLLSQFLSTLSILFFVLGLILCPIVVIICLVWAALTGMMLTSLGRR